MHDLFSRFVPADVVDEVISRADDNLRLGAVEADCTVLFSDLRGFTSFSETRPAQEVIEVVNCYLNEMTEAILAAGGTLVAYMGDGIMAVFGAPLEQSDHADRAVAAAREMIGPRLDSFNAWLSDEGYDHTFVMGVGLNSGPVMAGNIGSEQRVEYTALGDTTNTASRLEGMTKDSGAHAVHRGQHQGPSAAPAPRVGPRRRVRGEGPRGARPGLDHLRGRSPATTTLGRRTASSRSGAGMTPPGPTTPGPTSPVSTTTRPTSGTAPSRPRAGELTGRPGAHGAVAGAGLRRGCLRSAGRLRAAASRCGGRRRRRTARRWRSHGLVTSAPVVAPDGVSGGKAASSV